MLPRLVILASKLERETYAEQAAKDLSVNRFSIFSVAPVDGTITIDQMRELSPLFLTQTPDRRIIIVDSFDMATVEAQNSLLKLLEEKTGNTLFILFADQPEGILPTIRSRSIIVYPGGRNTAADKNFPAAWATDFTSGSLAFLNREDHLLKTKADVLERIDNLVGYFQKEIIKQPSIKTACILRKLLSTRQEIQSANANPQFAYDILLIFISEAATIK